jgi:hypothetical protein
VSEVLRTPGAALPSDTAAFMESRFGHDFSHVRVHADPRAAASARALNADAYTAGAHVIFAPGKFAPRNGDGKRLLAHELAHVVQQQSGGVSDSASESTRSSLERLADVQAEHALRAAPTSVGSPAVAAPPIQRQASTQPPPDRTFGQRWGSQIPMLRRMFHEQRYGCWCGPGNVCTETRDAIDACCKEHDLAYARLGVTSGTPAPGQVDMWSPEGFKRTMLADGALVACTQITKLDLHFYGPAAAAYREGVALIFGTRAAIAGWLMSNSGITMSPAASPPTGR